MATGENDGRPVDNIISHRESDDQDTLCAGQSEKYAHGYDSVLAQKLHASRTAARQAGWFLPYLRPGMRLLDCGCATGSITIGLAKAVSPGQVIGVDISQTEVERARARAAEAEITNIRFEVGDITQLDFAHNHFDALFCHSVLEHVGKPDKALREMHRVLKRGGAIGVRNTDMGGFLVAPADELLTRFLAIYEADWAGVGGHPRLGRDLRGLLNEAGFIDVEASASYEVYSDLEKRNLMSQIVVSRLTESDFVERVTECGLANNDDLAAIRAAWLAWPERTDAFFATAHGEVVGRKE